MSQDAWPTPREPSREPLPRVEDLPVAEQGYEQESVRAAFDSFYRHAAQLDAALRTLEAVDSFHRQAAALRADIRALRGAGWTQQPWSATPAYGYASRAPREGVSPAVWRIAGEAAFLIAVAVGLGVAKVSWWVIVLVMAFAWLLVGLLEWAATRDRFAVARSAAQPHPVVEAPASPDRTEEDAQGWTAFEEAQEPSDAMTMIGTPLPADEPVIVGDAAPEPAPTPEAESPPAPEEDAEPEPEQEQEQEPEPAPEAEAVPAAEAESEPEPESELEDRPEPEQRRRWWRRSRTEDVPPELPDLPRHVRVLPADPWEEGPEDFEEPDEETGENVGEESPRRLFRRR